MILAITPGDPEGIGPEIVWKTLRSKIAKKLEAQGVSFLCIGATEPFVKMGVPIRKLTDLSQLNHPPKSSNPAVWLWSAPDKTKKFLPGFQSGWAIEAAATLAKKNLVAALVTGPISKERLQKGGFKYPGHTEFLADLCKTKRVTMMLANDTLRITLVTTHLALKDVSKKLTRKDIQITTQQTIQHLRDWWGITRPSVAVAALNPHAGEAGLFGREEIETISPAIRSMQRLARGNFELSGPHPADTLFAKHSMAKQNIVSNAAREKPYDAVVCMYHDQGLIPVKLLDFPKTVNVTLGLPIVRTSVDHGVGFDIAGQGIADPSSMQAAIELATHIVRNRKK